MAKVQSCCWKRWGKSFCLLPLPVTLFQLGQQTSTSFSARVNDRRHGEDCPNPRLNSHSDTRGFPLAISLSSPGELEDARRATDFQHRRAPVVALVALVVLRSSRRRCHRYPSSALVAPQVPAVPRHTASLSARNLS